MPRGRVATTSRGRRMKHVASCSLKGLDIRLFDVELHALLETLLSRIRCLVDAGGHPVPSLESWRLAFTGNRYALWTDGTRFAELRH